jgi:hypothetical protein
MGIPDSIFSENALSGTEPTRGTMKRIFHAQIVPKTPSEEDAG